MVTPAVTKETTAPPKVTMVETLDETVETPPEGMVVVHAAFDTETVVVVQQRKPASQRQGCTGSCDSLSLA